MNAKVKYSAEEIGELKVVADFLPPPSELAFRVAGVKVTLRSARKVATSSRPKQTNTIRRISA